MSSSRKAIFAELRDNLKLVSESIKDDRSPRIEKELVIEEFWPQFENCLKTVSSECTKICLAFSSHPVPSSSGCCSFRERVESATLMLVSIIYKLPSSQGTRLRDRVFNLALNIVNSVCSLVVVIGEHADAGHQTALQCTGGVWEYCDSVNSLPKDAKQLTIEVVRQSYGLVKDAVDEIEEEVKNEDETSGSDDGDNIFESNWTNEDKKLLGPCIGIIKVARSMLKKIQDAIKKNGSCDSANKVEQLETICNRVDEISPCVDDVIESVYPPVTHDLVFQRTESLMNKIKSLLSESPSLHFTGEDDQKWIDFLSNALEHNYSKLQALI